MRFGVGIFSLFDKSDWFPACEVVNIIYTSAAAALIMQHKQDIIACLLNSSHSASSESACLYKVLGLQCQSLWKFYVSA